ncbi:MAG TPA: DUF2062 domain-containing protein [Methylomirabilota bacterium]|jgi:hypothetical protein
MRRGLQSLLARFRNALHLDDPPWKIALALAVGVFISCTPFYGLQTLLSIAVAWVLRLNRAATVAGAWLNLPWFAPFVYAGALAVGAAIMPHVKGVAGQSLTLLVGTTIVGAVAAVVTYAVALALIRRRRARAAALGQGARRHAA